MPATGASRMTAKAFDEKASTIRDALKRSIRTILNAGFDFDGRIHEDFKLRRGHLGQCRSVASALCRHLRTAVCATCHPRLNRASWGRWRSSISMAAVVSIGASRRRSGGAAADPWFARRFGPALRHCRERDRLSTGSLRGPAGLPLRRPREVTDKGFGSTSVLCWSSR